MSVSSVLMIKTLYRTSFSTCIFEVQGINTDNFGSKVFELADSSRKCVISGPLIDALDQACGNKKEGVLYWGESVVSVSCNGKVDQGKLTSILPVKSIGLASQVTFEGWENDVKDITSSDDILKSDQSFKQIISNYCGSKLFNSKCRHKATRAIIQHALSGRSKAEGSFSCFFNNINTGYAPKAGTINFDDGVEIAALTKGTRYRSYTLGNNQFFELISPSKSLKFVLYHGKQYFQPLQSDCTENECFGNVIATSSTGITHENIGKRMELIMKVRTDDMGKIAGDHINIV